VVNVAGHRLGTMEVESALVSHPHVAEAAVVGRPDELKGQGLVAFVTLKKGIDTTDPKAEAHALREHVTREIGAIAVPTRSASPTRCPRRARARSCAPAQGDRLDGRGPGRHHHARGRDHPLAPVGHRRRRGMTPTVPEAIARIEARQPVIRAFVSTRLPEARADHQARAAEKPRSPLHGVPFGLKDEWETLCLPPPAARGAIARAARRWTRR
jgi:hypothetical protein